MLPRTASHEVFTYSFAFKNLSNCINLIPFVQLHSRNSGSNSADFIADKFRYVFLIRHHFPSINRTKIYKNKNKIIIIIIIIIDKY